MGKVTTADSIEGLIAVLSNQLREANPGQEIGVSFGDLCDGLAMLQLEKGYDLSLDFDCNPNWYSRSLEAMIFQLGCWGRANNSRKGIYMTEQQSKNIMASIEKSYGQEGIKQINEMADQYLRNKSHKKLVNIS